jgi:hypothetical protein
VDLVMSPIGGPIDCAQSGLEAPLLTLWFPKIRSGRIRAMRQNQRIIQFDACDLPCLERVSPICSSRDAGLKPRTCFSVIS